MTIAHRGLKVKLVGQGQGHGQTNAVSLTLIEGSFFLAVADIIHASFFL